MKRIFSPAILNQILDLRLFISRAGEEDSLAWWNSYSLTDGGQWALNRLFPKSAIYAGARLSIESAMLVHTKEIGHRPAITLFNLGTDLDNGVMRQLDLRRMDDEVLIIPSPVHTLDELQDQLYQLAGFTEEDFISIRSAEIKGNLVELGVLTKFDLSSLDIVVNAVRRLAAAYVLSKSHLIVPYYLVKD